ncbi:MAG: type I 3-dehydroquinate dehydratase [Thermoplasmata archaeon]|nr:MAG: type I 3-dehydroquinate dehydratase [Thermoplasmata archaeon]
MTKLCVVATGNDPDSLVLRAHRALEVGADMVELRLDHLDDPVAMTGETVGAAVALEPLVSAEVIASVRAPKDGGLFHGTEEDRQSLLFVMASAGLPWIDLEGYLPPYVLDDLSAQARSVGTRVVVSWHVEREEDWDDVGDRARAAVKDGTADAAKIVLQVEDRQGLDGLMGFSWSLSKERVPHVLLPSGRLSRIGRIMAPATNTLWVYSELAERDYFGPLGLPRFDELDAAWRRMGTREVPGAPARPTPPLEAKDSSGDWTLLALLGDPVAHTNSPVVHQTAMRRLGMRGAYLPYRTSPGDVADALADLALAGARGANVTVPLKTEAAAAVDELGQSARLSGAVNTIVFEAEGRTRGENTDADGVMMVARELLGGDGGGRTALVLGTGGAARGAVVGLADWGARVLATGRNPDHLATMISDLVGLAEPINAVNLRDVAGSVDILVQATSQGMHGVPAEGPVVPVKVLEETSAGAVLEMVYAPGGTDLVKAARLLGLPAAGGERALLHQAVAGFRHWTGRDPPAAEMDRELTKALGQ